jgi:hypothetical protein
MHLEEPTIEGNGVVFGRKLSLIESCIFEPLETPMGEVE